MRREVCFSSSLGKAGHGRRNRALAARKEGIMCNLVQCKSSSGKDLSALTNRLQSPAPSCMLAFWPQNLAFLFRGVASASGRGACLARGLGTLLGCGGQTLFSRWDVQKTQLFFVVVASARLPHKRNGGWDLQLLQQPHFKLVETRCLPRPPLLPRPCLTSRLHRFRWSPAASRALSAVAERDANQLYAYWPRRCCQRGRTRGVRRVSWPWTGPLIPTGGVRGTSSSLNTQRWNWYC